MERPTVCFASERGLKYPNHVRKNEKKKQDEEEEVT
jgi:hypothetical protein